MPRIHGHERLRLRGGKQESLPADSFLEDLAEAYGLGLTGPVDVRGLGRGTKWDEMETANVRRLESLGRGCSGARNAAWAAFYLGVTLRHPGGRSTWHCVIQQQLTKAFYRLPAETAAQLIAADALFNHARRDWTNTCSGALAVARVGHAFHGTSAAGRLYLPRLREDAYDKIDLIFQCDSLERGLCMQIKSDAATEKTTALHLDEDAVRADPSRYLEQVVRGVDRFRLYNRGSWTPLLLTVGQRAYLDRAEVRNCPDVASAVAKMIERHLPPLPATAPVP